ncbi:MAG: hypothetical protein ACYTGH_07635 [Planctomycetota bacterium]
MKQLVHAILLALSQLRVRYAFLILGIRYRLALGEGRGKHFDPAVVDAFLNIEESFIRIREEFADAESV